MIFYNLAGLIGFVLSAVLAVGVACSLPTGHRAVEMVTLIWAASLSCFALLYDRAPPASMAEAQRPGRPAPGRSAILGGPLLLAPFAFLALFGALTYFGELKPAPSLLFWIGMPVLGLLAIFVAGATLPFRQLPENTPCPNCGKPLRSNRARQCLECGAAWHGESRRSTFAAETAASALPESINGPLLWLGAGCGVFIVLLILVAFLVAGGKDGHRSVAQTGPSEATPTPVDAQRPPAPNGNSPANLGEFAGVWQGVSNNHGFTEAWRITNTDGNWNLDCRYYRGSEEVGMFHSDKCQVENGSLVCSTVFDVAPLPGWIGCTWTVRLIDRDTIQADWRDRSGFTGGGRLMRTKGR